jgi:hypothetical protein
MLWCGNNPKITDLLRILQIHQYCRYHQVAIKNAPTDTATEALKYHNRRAGLETVYGGSWNCNVDVSAPTRPLYSFTGIWEPSCSF